MMDYMIKVAFVAAAYLPSLLLFFCAGVSQGLAEEASHYGHKGYWFYGRFKKNRFAAWMRRSPSTSRTWYDHSLKMSFVYDLVNDGYHGMKTAESMLVRAGALAETIPLFVAVILLEVSMPTNPLPFIGMLSALLACVALISLPVLWVGKGGGFYLTYKVWLRGRARSHERYAGEDLVSPEPHEYGWT